MRDRASFGFDWREGRREQSLRERECEEDSLVEERGTIEHEEAELTRWILSASNSCTLQDCEWRFEVR